MFLRDAALPFFFPTPLPALFLLPPPYLRAVAALLLLALVIVVTLLALYKRRGARAPLALVGRAASVEESLSPEGSVMVGGELWRARTASGRHVGRGRANVRVVGARGHLLLVVERGETEARG